MKNKFISKFIGILLIAGFAFVAGGSMVESYKADHSIGMERQAHSDNAQTLALIAVAAVMIPAVNAMRMTTSLGVKNLVTRPDGGVVTELQNFLTNYLEKYGQGETKKAIGEGKIFFDPIVYYIRYDITGLSGKQRIVSEATQKVMGATNFNLGYLPKFTNFAFNKIGVSYVDDATGASVAAKALTGWSSVRSSVDKSVANGEIIISSAKNTILEHAIAPFLREAANTQGTIGGSDYELEQARVLKENELVEIEINLPNTVPSVAAHTYGIEVRLTGVQVRLRG
jgi:hypothetical protein